MSARNILLCRHLQNYSRISMMQGLWPSVRTNERRSVITTTATPLSIQGKSLGKIIVRGHAFNNCEDILLENQFIFRTNRDTIFSQTQLQKYFKQRAKFCRHYQSIWHFLEAGTKNLSVFTKAWKASLTCMVNFRTHFQLILNRDVFTFLMRHSA